MNFVLRFAGTYNLLAGACLVVFYHESYKLLGLSTPRPVLPVQLSGVMIALFGVGYWLVALNPVENRNLLMLGFLSKAFGTLLGVTYVIKGQLPWTFLPAVFLGDIIYLPLFWIIMRRLYRLAADRR